jgi:hypothetical protein
MLGYLADERYRDLMSKMTEISKMLYGLAKTLN